MGQGFYPPAPFFFVNCIHNVMQITKKKGKIDPASIANLWFRGKPQDEDRTNHMEMYYFVGALSNKEANLVAAIHPNSLTQDLIVYNKPISKNLLVEEYEALENAVSLITKNPKMFQCSFVSREQNKDNFTGFILFAHPPSYYDDKDRFVLFSILQHELRHAMDFVDNNNKPIPNDYMFPNKDGGYEIDVDLYSRNITEVRAHADQAKVILKLLGRKLAKEAIKTSKFTLADTEMREAMIILIDALADEASISENISDIANPPAIVVKSEDHEVRKLENHLTKILELLKFSNFVKFKN